MEITDAHLLILPGYRAQVHVCSYERYWQVLLCLRNIFRKMQQPPWPGSRAGSGKSLFIKTAAADMKMILCVYVGMLGVTSLMLAPEIRAQNFNNLPESHVMAYFLI